MSLEHSTCRVVETEQLSCSTLKRCLYYIILVFFLSPSFVMLKAFYTANKSRKKNNHQSLTHKIDTKSLTVENHLWPSDLYTSPAHVCFATTYIRLFPEF